MTFSTSNRIKYQSDPSNYHFLRFFLLCILTLRGSIGCCQALESFEKNGRYGLKNGSEELIAPVYEMIGWSNDAPIEGNLVGFKEGEKWGLMTVSGKKLTDPKYYLIEPLSADYIKVAVTKALTNQLDHGLLDQRGKIKLSCSYFSIDAIGMSYRVGVYNDGNVNYGLINSDLTMSLPVEYTQITHHRGIFLAEKRGKGWAAHRSNGSKIYESYFDSFQVRGHMLEIVKKGATGAIDLREERLLLACNFKSIEISEDTIVPRQSRSWEIYNRDLQRQMTLKGDSLTTYDDLIVTYLNGHQRVYDGDNELLPDQYFEVKQSIRPYQVVQDKGFNIWRALVGGKEIATGDSIHFDGSYFFILNQRKWDILNKYGRKVNKWPLEAVRPSRELYVRVQRNGHWGLLDFQGETVADFVYDEIGTGIDLSFPAKYVGSWGILNAFGRWITQPQYQNISVAKGLYIAENQEFKYVISAKGEEFLRTRGEISPANESLEISLLGSKGLISTSGVTIFSPIYQDVIHNGSFFIGQRAEGSVVKDSQGDFVLKLDAGYENVYSWREGLFHVRKNGLHGFVDNEGRIRIAHRYDSARSFYEGMAAIKLIGKWGYIDVDEVLVVQPTFEDVGDFHNGLAIVKRGKYGLINKKGELVFDLEYGNISRTARGSYILEHDNGTVGLASQNGDMLLSPTFDSMEDIGDGLIVVDRNGKKGIYRNDGQLLVSFEYAEIKAVGKNLLALTRDKR